MKGLIIGVGKLVHINNEKEKGSEEKVNGELIKEIHHHNIDALRGEDIMKQGEAIMPRADAQVKVGESEIEQEPGIRLNMEGDYRKYSTLVIR